MVMGVWIELSTFILGRVDVNTTEMLRDDFICFDFSPRIEVSKTMGAVFYEM